MRRKETLTIWPSIADLMTLLAVPALCVSVGLFVGPYSYGELVKNRYMLQAVDEVDSFIEVLRRSLLDTSEVGQDLRFGEDLIYFDRNGKEGRWRDPKAGPKQLIAFCGTLSEELEKVSPILKLPYRSLLVIEIEGHADRKTCGGDPSCNWEYSSARASWFVQQLNNPQICPGGGKWTRRTAGFSDAIPHGKSDDDSRRIALRIVPDYQQIIEAFKASANPPPLVRSS